MTRIRLATRGSALALAQTNMAADALRAADPNIEVEVVEVSTQGDQDRITSLRVLGGQGIFVGAVREALLDSRADVAVHSLKDVPTTPAPGLTLGAMLERGDPRDVFVGRDGRRLAELPAGARVGTSASRRIALVRALRPDLEVAEIRGNVDTRIAKVNGGDYDGAILAAAGLDRLGRLGEASQVFEAEAFLPSPGQGVIALECRADDDAALALLRAIDHAATRAAAEAERGVLAALGTGCDLAVGAYGRIDGDLLSVRAMLGGDRDGTEPVFGEATGGLTAAEELGRGLGERLKTAYESTYGALS
ncbi:MAG: hydroxymethylbilane synthase [Dehalococcoidia bacterium]|nr:hydroxymethylbilane synthase [Dehalococcoidia bacterium]